MNTADIQKKLILAINPGSTTTKVAVFRDKDLLWKEVLPYSSDQSVGGTHVWQQLEIRLDQIKNMLSERALRVSDLTAVVGRGGLLKSVPGGTYRVNKGMLKDARSGYQGEHPANLGCALAYAIATEADLPAFVVDPISVDEFEPLARYSGHPKINRRCLSHALNIHAVARFAADQLSIPYQASNFVVVHLGGGISVAAVRGGRIIDVNDASSDGPFSPERTGGLPLQPFVGLCFSGDYTESQIRKLVMTNGGLKAYLGTRSAKTVEERIAAGDHLAAEVYQAMIYQIAKEIGAMATVLHGRIQAVVLTGGLAHSEILVEWITNRVSFIAKVLTFPGELEMEAMSTAVLRVLEGDEEVKVYP